CAFYTIVVWFIQWFIHGHYIFIILEMNDTVHGLMNLVHVITSKPFPVSLEKVIFIFVLIFVHCSIIFSEIESLYILLKLVHSPRLSIPKKALCLMCFFNCKQNHNIIAFIYVMDLDYFCN
ncbi:hypothetical protein ACJX0J_017450, partial [Zea mays]